MTILGAAVVGVLASLFAQIVVGVVRRPRRAATGDYAVQARQSVSVIVERRGMFAAIRSRKHGGAFELPGGKVNQGEAVRTAARREANEEIGDALGSAPLSPLGVFRHAHVGVEWECSVYVGTYNGEPLRGSDEGATVWATREQLLGGTYGGLNVRIFAAYDAWKDRR